MRHFRRSFHNFVKNPDFSAKSGSVYSKKSGSGPKSRNPDQSGGTAFHNKFLTVEVDLKINYWCKASMSPTGARILGWPVGTLKFLCLKYSRIMHVILVGVGFIINMPEMCRNWLRYMVCLHCGSHIVLKITNKSELNMSKWLDVGSKIWIKQLWR